MASTAPRPLPRILVLATLLAVLSCAGLVRPAEAQTCYVFRFGLSGDEEVPPVVTAATGNAEFRMETTTNTLDFEIAYVDLSSAETAAHLHGFAEPGQEGPPLFGLPPGNPKIGQLVYAELDEDGILDGLTYVNIHSSNFPDGEIRGQVDDPLPCQAFADGFESGTFSAWSSCVGCPI